MPVDDVAIVLAHSAGGQLRRIRPGVGFRDGERLQPQGAARDRRQIFTFLFFRAMTQKRAHGVHLSVTGSRVSAGSIDFLEDDRRLKHSEACAAIFLRDQDSQVPRRCQRVDEFLRVAKLAILGAPVFVWKAPAERANTITEVVIRFHFTPSTFRLRIDSGSVGTLTRVSRTSPERPTPMRSIRS